MLRFLSRTFTWWTGATWGTLLWSWRHGRRVGTDGFGNVYLEGGRDVHGQPRRWVIYQGDNDASRVPPEWFGWLHGQTDLVPEALPPARVWEAPPLPNQTGLPTAFRPAGALERGGNRAAATGDYEAWSPEA
jgi:NADH:ubiquinone oxidoreductase subunit